VIVEEREYARLLGYPWGTTLEGDVRERAVWASAWFEKNGKPRIYCVEKGPEGRKNVAPAVRPGFTLPRESSPGGAKEVRMPLTPLPGLRSIGMPTPASRPGLHSFGPPGLSGTITAITAGYDVDVEVSRLWDAGRVDESYFLDRYAAAVVEKMAADLGPYQSPGTGTIPFEEQWTLFSYIQPLKPAMEMLPSGMLNPKNSLLAFVPFDALSTPNPCTRCDLRGCTFRRTTP